MPKRNVNFNQKLYRSRTNKVIAGVCGGIGEYFGIDPTWIRLAWLLFIFAGGAGVIAYIIAWIIIPENPSTKAVKLSKTSVIPCCGDAGIIIGAILILIGGFFLINTYFPFLNFLSVWPAVIIIVGAILIIKSRSNERK